MIGIDISDQSIKLIQLANTRDRTLLCHAWRAVPAEVISKGLVVNRDKIRDLVRDIFQQCRSTKGQADTVVASIPETQSFLRVIEMPIMSSDEVTEAIQWEVSQHIPFGIDNVYIDWQVLRDGHVPAAGRWEILVGAAQKKVVDPLYDVLKSLNLDIAAFELESQAIVRSLVSDEIRSKQGLLIVDLGSAATNVVIHDHGTIRFTASLQKGATDVTKVLSPSEAEVLNGPPQTDRTSDQALGQRLEAGEDMIVQEVRGIVEFYNSIDAQHEVREIILTGGGANLPGLDKAFLRFFDTVHVQRGNPWVNIIPHGQAIRTPLSLQESVHFSTALGLALRPVTR